MKTDNKMRLSKGSASQPCQNGCCAGSGDNATTAGSGGQSAVVFDNLFDINSIGHFLEPEKPVAGASSGMAQCPATDGQTKAESPADIRAGLRRTVFRVSGLDCGDCAGKLEKRLAALPGVKSASVNFGAGKLTVEHAIAEATLLQTVQQAGYGATTETSRQPLPTVVWWKNGRTLATGASGILLVQATVLDWLGMAEGIVIGLYALTAITGGFHAARSGLYSIRALSLDMNFLMTMAIIGAAAIGEWSEGAAIAFLFSVGNTLQAYTMDKTRQSIRSLMELAPPVAWVRRDNAEKRLPVEEIVVGDIVIVKPGERIAMDGMVRSGVSAVNQATITGESIPVEKAAGDPVYAGTVNEHGALEIERNKERRKFDPRQNLPSRRGSAGPEGPVAAVCRCLREILYPAGPGPRRRSHGCALVGIPAAFCFMVL